VEVIVQAMSRGHFSIGEKELSKEMQNAKAGTENSMQHPLMYVQIISCLERRPFLPLVERFGEINQLGTRIASRIQNTLAQFVDEAAPIATGGQDKTVGLSRLQTPIPVLPILVGLATVWTFWDSHGPPDGGRR